MRVRFRWVDVAAFAACAAIVVAIFLASTPGNGNGHGLASQHASRTECLYKAKRRSPGAVATARRRYHACAPELAHFHLPGGQHGQGRGTGLLDRIRPVPRSLGDRPFVDDGTGRTRAALQRPRLRDLSPQWRPRQTGIWKQSACLRCGEARGWRKRGAPSDPTRITGPSCRPMEFRVPWDRMRCRTAHAPGSIYAVELPCREPECRSGALRRSLQPSAPAKQSLSVQWRTEQGTFADGSPYELLAPTFEVDKLRSGPLEGDVQLSSRVAPPLLGLGLLEAIAVEDILARADPDDHATATGFPVAPTG